MHYRETVVDNQAEKKLSAAEERPASREVDEDYDETAADTLMSMAQTGGGRKRSLERNDEMANLDSDSKRPKPAESAMEEDQAAVTSDEPAVTAAAPQQQHTEEPVAEVVPQAINAEVVEKSPVVAEQQPVVEQPATEQSAEEPKDEPMEESAPEPEPASAPAPAPAAEDSTEDNKSAAAEEEEEEEEEQPVREAAEEGEADAEKEEGETDAVEPSKEDEDAGEISEPEAGEVTPSPEATTA
jgi:hypothetical protein